MTERKDATNGPSGFKTKKNKKNKNQWSGIGLALKKKIIKKN